MVNSLFWEIVFETSITNNYLSSIIIPTNQHKIFQYIMFLCTYFFGKLKSHSYHRNFKSNMFNYRVIKYRVIHQFILFLLFQIKLINSFNPSSITLILVQNLDSLIRVQFTRGITHIFPNLPTHPLHYLPHDRCKW